MFSRGRDFSWNTYERNTYVPPFLDLFRNLDVHKTFRRPIEGPNLLIQKLDFPNWFDLE